MKKPDDMSCFDCPDRKPKCHSVCQKHQAWQTEQAKIKESRRKDNLKHQPIEKPYLRPIVIKKKER